MKKAGNRPQRCLPRDLQELEFSYAHLIIDFSWNLLTCLKPALATLVHQPNDDRPIVGSGGQQAEGLRYLLIKKITLRSIRIPFQRIHAALMTLKLA